MQQAGRVIMVAGMLLVAMGAMAWSLGRYGFTGLPGDITIRRQGVVVCIPIATCLVVSAVITAAWWLWLHRG